MLRVLSLAHECTYGPKELHAHLLSKSRHNEVLTASHGDLRHLRPDCPPVHAFSPSLGCA